MIKFIIVTVLFQTLIMFGLLFYGPLLIPEDVIENPVHKEGLIYPGYKYDENGNDLYEQLVDSQGASRHYTMVFTVFVLLQVFNMVNA